MKKTILLGALMLVTIIGANAQDQALKTVKKYNFGIRHGYSTWDIKAENAGYSEINLFAGLFVETEISKKFSLRLEANYSRKALLEIPLILNYKVSDKFEIFGGAEATLSLDKYDDDNIYGDKSLGSSLIIGAQYNINSNWFVDARYIHGLSNQYSIFKGFENDPSFGKRRTVNFGIGYKF